MSSDASVMLWSDPSFSGAILNSVTRLMRSVERNTRLWTVWLPVRSLVWLGLWSLMRLYWFRSMMSISLFPPGDGFLSMIAWMSGMLGWPLGQ